MDTTQTTHISLCSGYGGIDIGLKRSIKSLRTIAYAEIEAFAAPIWSDLKSFPWAKFRGLVDIISGGYPCQPFSAAGLRRGKEDPRHLWPYIADGIRSMRPRLCFFENVEGHISLGLSTVISDLEELGYRVSWGIFSAAEVGAPHQRKRVFILAHCNSQRLEGSKFREFHIQERREEQGNGHAGQCSRNSCNLADTNSSRGGKDWESSKSRAISIEQPSCFEGRGDAGEVPERQAWPARPGQQQYEWEPPRVVGNSNCEGSQERSGERGAGIQGTDANGGADADGEAESPLGGNPDGSASGLDYAKLCESCDNRTDELRLLGNGVIPATAEKAFRVLLEKLQHNTQ